MTSLPPASRPTADPSREGRGTEDGGSEHALSLLEFPRVLALVARYASSEAGRRRVRELRPLVYPDAAEDALRVTGEMTRLYGRSGGWAPPVIPELDAELRRLAVEGAVLEGDALHGLSVLLASGESARRDVLEEEETLPGLAELARGLLRAPALREKLEDAVDESGAVRDEASPDLRRIRGELRGARSSLVGRLERFAARLRDRIRVPDASVTVRGGRYCIPIRREGRSEVGGIVHDESSSGQTLFVEPPVAIEPMNRIRELEMAEGREVRRILAELTSAARPHARELRHSLYVLEELDAIWARARYALDHGGHRPDLGERGRHGPYRVVEGYHPLLLAGQEETVPFGLTLAPEESVLLISGPNAGGKTVLLKTIGLLSAMAQSGIVPPVGPDTRLPLFTRFFAILGDEQSIEASLSSFSAQVGLLRTILEEADGGSLILLDEFGSHTDPSEGAALAAASLLRLADQAGLTVATTHLGDLKALAGEDERIVNASLAFDAGRLRPTYRLRRDRPGRSYALEIAARLGVPASVLEAARERMGSGERRMESVLAELEEREAELSRLTGEGREREAELAEREEAIGERERALAARRAELESDARERAERYLLEARSEVEAAIERLERRARSGDPGAEALGDAASEARRAVEEAVRESREARPSRAEPGPLPEVTAGEAVRVRSLGRTGRVLEVREDRIVVEAGGVRLSLPPREVAPASDGEAEGAGAGGSGGAAARGATGIAGHRAASRPAGRRPTIEPRSEVDLRGLRVDEAEGELVPVLDAAIVADLPRLRIIHGKGTGALRERVREVLTVDPRVVSFRGGGPEEGGSGVTVVRLTPDEGDT
jgi:DNA mismatch repair protein MutS2